jgi:hypothetical protein
MSRVATKSPCSGDVQFMRVKRDNGIKMCASSSHAF